jgi:hypothetical protein
MSDLSLFRIVQSIYKMKAIIIELAGRETDSKFFKDVKKTYIDMVTIDNN